MMKKFISLKKIGGRRWLFSKQQRKEHGGAISAWILAASSWADNGFWVDLEGWND
jgi:hypothetical protein